MLYMDGVGVQKTFSHNKQALLQLGQTETSIVIT
jgi:hypothetical protein